MEKTALVIYGIPGIGIKWGHFVEGLPQFYNVNLGTVGENPLDLFGLGIKKSLDQEGVGPALYHGLEEPEAPGHDLFARGVVVRHDVQSFAVVVVHGNPVFLEGVAQEVVHQLEPRTLPGFLAPSAITRTLGLTDDLLCPPIMLVAPFQGKGIGIQAQDDMDIIGNHGHQVGIKGIGIVDQGLKLLVLEIKGIVLIVENGTDVGGVEDRSGGLDLDIGLKAVRLVIGHGNEHPGTDPLILAIHPIGPFALVDKVIEGPLQGPENLLVRLGDLIRIDGYLTAELLGGCRQAEEKQKKDRQ